jgi:hypothetical protein
MQVLSPGVEDTDEADLCSEPLWVGCDFEHGGRTGAEEQVIQSPCIRATESVQFMRQREDNVKVRNGQEFSFACSEPALASLCLALRAVPVSAGVIRDGLMVASRTPIDMAAQSRSPAAPDGVQDAQLLVAQPRTSIDEAVALLAE